MPDTFLTRVDRQWTLHIDPVLMAGNINTMKAWLIEGVKRLKKNFRRAGGSLGKGRSPKNSPATDNMPAIRPIVGF